MNYESSGMYALTDETGTSRRRWLILGGVAAVVVILIAAFVLMRPSAKPAAESTTRKPSGNVISIMDALRKSLASESRKKR